jgi:DNA (cytosine-5)-methyltransferase 1
MPNFFEFFAGGGMARAGLGPKWNCLFSNDFDHKKSAAYRNNWGDDVLKTADIRKLKAADLPESTDLAWASFPCQDLSLAGGGAGLRGERSGTFWPFWELMKDLIRADRAPKMIVLENVCGTITSHGGDDFTAICETFDSAGYRYGAIVIDAAHFVPHSRPRLFVIGVHNDLAIPKGLQSTVPSKIWHPAALRKAMGNLPPKVAKSWIWWNLPDPAERNIHLSDIVEDMPDGVSWFTSSETQSLLAKMSDVNMLKVTTAQKLGRRIVGTVYKRTRLNDDGVKVQRAEVRFDEIAGCLRTPAGGSSRQIILIVEKGKVKARLISARETARLMGLPDTYKLPQNYNEAYHLTGDGVVVPVVRHLAMSILEPILKNNKHLKAAA